MAERIRTDPPEDAKEEDTGDSQTEPAPGVVWTDRASLPHGYTVASPTPPYPRHQAGKRDDAGADPGPGGEADASRPGPDRRGGYGERLPGGSRLPGLGVLRGDPPGHPPGSQGVMGPDKTVEPAPTI